MWCDEFRFGPVNRFESWFAYLEYLINTLSTSLLNISLTSSYIMPKITTSTFSGSAQSNYIDSEQVSVSNHFNFWPEPRWWNSIYSPLQWRIVFSCVEWNSSKKFERSWLLTIPSCPRKLWIASKIEAIYIAACFSAFSFLSFSTTQRTLLTSNCTRMVFPCSDITS